MYTEPWLLEPQLKQDYLKQVAEILVNVRAEVIERHEPESGDTPSVLGLRAYEWCRSRLIKSAQKDDFPWLFILTPEGRFTFAIGESQSIAIPVRFSRNDPAELPDRKLITSDEWGRQMSLFEETSEYTNIRWFFIIDAPSGQHVQSAYFVGYSENNNIICKWEIPLEDKVLSLGDINEPLSQPIDIAPAQPKLKVIKKPQVRNDEEA